MVYVRGAYLSVDTSWNKVTASYSGSATKSTIPQQNKKLAPKCNSIHYSFNLESYHLGWGCSSIAECMLSIYEVLSSTHAHMAVSFAKMSGWNKEYSKHSNVVDFNSVSSFWDH